MGMCGKHGRDDMLQTRERVLANGAFSRIKPSKHEREFSQMEQNTNLHPPNARRSSHKWSNKPKQTLQTRDEALTIGAYDENKTSKCETGFSQMEQNTNLHPPKARESSHDWSKTQTYTLQTREKGLGIGAQHKIAV